MRKSLAMVVTFASLGLATLAFAQQGGFQGRGGAGGGLTDPIQLLQNASVKKELDITDEQMEKLPEAVRKALGEVLNEKQQKRLRQIELQQRGTNALLDAKLQKELKVTEEQANNIKVILEDSRKEMREAFKGGFGKDATEKLANLRKETTEKAMGVLTVDQRRAYKQLIGDEFKIERPTFGGAGGFGKNKKGDNSKDKIQ
jgi:Spy/CpxP family protein refolding chaperone